MSVEEKTKCSIFFPNSPLFRMELSLDAILYTLYLEFLWSKHLDAVPEFRPGPYMHHPEAALPSNALIGLWSACRIDLREKAKRRRIERLGSPFRCTRPAGITSARQQLPPAVMAKHWMPFGKSDVIIKKKYKKMCYDVVLFLRCLEFPHRVAFPLDDMFMALAMIQIAPIDHRC